MNTFINVDDLGCLKQALAEAQEIKKDRYKYQQLGRNKTLLMIFFNNSLRTRLSTQKAAMNLGMNVIVLDVNAGAWKLETEEEGRQLGILYFGEYGIREDGTADESFYIGYNMHWQPHSFALPTLPKEAEWELLTDTSGDGPGGKARILHQKSVEIPERTVVILRGICRKKEKNGGSKNE